MGIVAGVVHRDVKPENVLVTADHKVKIMDLGVAQLRDEALRLSQTGAFVGSVHYTAPERFRDLVADGRPPGRASLEPGLDLDSLDGVALAGLLGSAVGLTETEAQAQGIEYEKAQFPWAASGRALALGRDEGFTKLLFDKKTNRIIGAGIAGPHAGDLIAECALAIEMGADAVDLGHTIHAHPTLSETVNFAAEMFEGTITDLMPPKKKKH